MYADTKLILQQKLEEDFVGLEYKKIIKRAIALHFKNEEGNNNIDEQYELIKDYINSWAIRNSRSDSLSGLMDTNINVKNINNNSKNNQGEQINS